MNLRKTRKGGKKKNKKKQQKEKRPHCQYFSNQVHNQQLKQ